jgi:hypothetical protein
MVCLRNKCINTLQKGAKNDDDNNNMLTQKKLKKISKHKDLVIAVSRMWKVRTKILPVITGALGTIEKRLDQNLQLLPGHRSAIMLQITLMHTVYSIGKCKRKITLISC